MTEITEKISEAQNEEDGLALNAEGSEFSLVSNVESNRAELGRNSDNNFSFDVNKMIDLDDFFPGESFSNINESAACFNSDESEMVNVENSLSVCPSSEDSIFIFENDDGTVEGEILFEIDVEISNIENSNDATAPIDLDDFFPNESPNRLLPTPSDLNMQINDADLNECNTCQGVDGTISFKKVKQNKRVQARVNRENGEAYTGYSRVGSKVKQNVQRPARELGITCVSRYCLKSSLRNCNLFEEEERAELMTSFWDMNWGQKEMYVSQLVQSVPKKQPKGNALQSRRTTSKEYFLFKARGKRLQVCKKMFLATLGLREKMVRRFENNKGNFNIHENPRVIQKRRFDLRQQSEKLQAINERRRLLLQFLNDYPKLESHYCRKNTSKKYFQTTHQTLTDLYKDYKQFCKDSNTKPLSFPILTEALKKLKFCIFKPRKDQCDTCTEYKVGNLKSEKYEEHRANIASAKSEKESDTKEALKNLINLLCMDVQSVQLCPKLLASALFFKMKLQIHNFTIYNIISHDSSNYIWDETEGDLQASIFTSMIIYHIEKLLQQNSLPIVIYSDGCGYQNRNYVLSNAICHLAKKYSRVIEQKWLVVGHTQMECDSTHACIERRTKKMTLNLPSEFVTEVSEARKKPVPLATHHLTHQFFRNHDEPDLIQYASIRPGERKGDPKVKDLKCLKYTRDGKIYYKVRFQDEYQLLPQEFNEKLYREPKALFNERLKVSASKYEDLQELLQVLPSDTHLFYKNIPRHEPIKKKKAGQTVSESNEKASNRNETVNTQSTIKRKYVRKIKKTATENVSPVLDQLPNQSHVTATEIASNSKIPKKAIKAKRLPVVKNHVISKKIIQKTPYKKGPTNSRSKTGCIKNEFKTTSVKASVNQPKNSRYLINKK